MTYMQVAYRKSHSFYENHETQQSLYCSEIGGNTLLLLVVYPSHHHPGNLVNSGLK